MINKGKKLINPLGKCNRGSVHRVTAEDITLVDTVAAQNFEYKVWFTLASARASLASARASFDL
jgi:hypothetical protein